MSLKVRFIILTVFLFFAGNVIAQQDTTVYKIKWRKPVSLVLDGKYKEILSFDMADHQRSNQYLPSYFLIFKGTFSSSYELENVNWVSLSESELKSLPPGYEIQAEPKVILYNSDERGIYNTRFEIIPLRKSSIGVLEKAISFQVKLIPGVPSLSYNRINKTQRRVNAVSSSVLAQGDWYKLAFSQTGIYKIDYKFIKSLGLDPEQINVYNIQMWGNGGGMLPEKNSDPRNEDLLELPIFVSDGNDGKFDEVDYLLFYVQGPDVWRQTNEMPYFTFSRHLYSTESYCFLTIGNKAGKRISQDVPVSANPDLILTDYTSRFHHETDRFNFLSSGRKWYGEEFDNNSIQSFNIPANGVIPGSSIYIRSSFMNKSSQSSTVNTFEYLLNSVPFKSHSLSGGSPGIYDPIGTWGEYKDFISSDNFAGQKNLTFTIKYNKVLGVGIGYLDYFSLIFKDELAVNSNFLDFRNIDSRISGVVQYNLILSSPSELQIWDVTDLNNIISQRVELLGSQATFKYFSDSTLREFIAFSGTKFPAPLRGEKIANQNLRGNTTPNMLIVTHPLFKNQANKLADFRREHDNMEVVVASIDEIYNEFSSGATDLVAIRDFARMFYERPDNIGKKKFQYLLLFGDCSYDYKNIKSASNPQNFIPVYESEESLNPTESFSSDDYVGLLSPGEGTWSRSENDHLEIGIGRLPVKSPEEAESVVRKIIYYTTNPLSLGSWRQNLTFIADNEEGNEFLDNAEDLAKNPETPFLVNNYNIKKVYLAAYSKDFTGGAPAANKVIEEQFNNGTFMMNYIGHGGERQLASENVINLNTIGALKNYDKLPFMIAATCDFGKYDDPTLTSGGELFLINPAGGAIGLLCTTRPVFQNYNKRINAEFHKAAFSEEARNAYTLGDIIRECKNESVSGVYNRNFALLGDPSLKLAYPQLNIAITKVNGNDYVPFADTLKAQSKVTLSGHILKNGTIMTDFNGVVNALVFDKAFTYETIELPKYPFDVRESKIFDGSATVRAGEFSFTFIVPRNINYIVGSGKVSLYANVEDGRMIDASCGESRMLIGGGDKNAVKDDTKPEVKAYLNDESFVQDGITNENPLLIVKLSDENGISSISDIGGFISAQLNGGEKINLNSYYKADRDTYKSGTIRYRLTNLEEGKHTITVEAFDNSKNSGDKILDFIVAKKGNLAIKHLYNYPNPFTTNTVFHFDHNRAGDDLDVLLQVYTITGKLVKSLSLHSPSAPTHISNLVWDGKDDYGDNIGRGVYVYKLSVKALSDGIKKDEYQKLVILN